jgi:hypothetical protein
MDFVGRVAFNLLRIDAENQMTVGRLRVHLQLLGAGVP